MDTIFRTSYQAEAVKIYLLEAYDGIEASWNGDRYLSDGNSQIREWIDGKLRGYVFSMTIHTPDEVHGINIAFYEHGVTDQICARVFSGTYLGRAINPDEIGEDQHIESHYEPYGHAGQMAQWIHSKLEDWWDEKSFDNGSDA